MNTTTTIRTTNEGTGDTPDLARKRAINAHTGASELPLPEAPPRPKEETTAKECPTTKVEAGLITDSQHRGD